MQKLVLIFCAALAINAQAATVMWALPDHVNLTIYHGPISVGGPHALQMVYMVERPDNGSEFRKMMDGATFTGNDDWIIYSAPILEDGTVKGSAASGPIVNGQPLVELNINSHKYEYSQWFTMEYDFNDEEFDEIIRIALIAFFFDPDMEYPSGSDPFNGYWSVVMGAEIAKDQNGKYYMAFTKELTKPEEAWRTDFFYIPEPATGLLIFGGAAILLLRRRK